MSAYLFCQKDSLPLLPKSHSSPAKKAAYQKMKMKTKKKKKKVVNMGSSTQSEQPRQIWAYAQQHSRQGNNTCYSPRCSDTQ